MQVKNEFKGDEASIADLFEATFSASEGPEEGAVIGTLVRNLLGTTPENDICVFTAHDGHALIGGAVFSRLTYSEDPRSVFVLSPMAIAADRQGQGIGQALLRQALNALRENGVAVVMTYGDPAFYGKVGFQPVEESTAAAPLPLSMPQGWIGQSLTESPLIPLRGACRCVAALHDPALW